MEQYLLSLPDNLAEKMRKMIQDSCIEQVSFSSHADNKSFTFHFGSEQYPATLANLPCIVETHKTFDDMVYYKSNDIGQILIIHENESQQQTLEKEGLSSGITPPTTNITKRKYAKTRKHGPFPKDEVARVEEDLSKIITGGPVEDIHEELVDFVDWMVDERHPNGITIVDEVAFIKRVPQAAEVFQTKGETPTLLNIGSEFDGEQGHSPTLELSPPIPASPNRGMEIGSLGGMDDDDEDLEEDIFGDMDTKQETSEKNDPRVQQLTVTKEKWQADLAEMDNTILALQRQIESSPNIVVMNRFKEKLKVMTAQRQNIYEELEKIKAQLERG